MRFYIILGLFCVASLEAGISKGIQWAIACGLPTFKAGIGIESLVKDVLGNSNFTESMASEVVQKYVHDELRHVKDARKIKILINKQQGPWDYSANYKAIFLGVDQTTKKALLEELLSKKNLSADEQNNLAMINYLLHHEAAHIANHDYYKNIVANLLIPNITWVAFNKSFSILKNTRMPSKINTVIKIPTFIGVCISNTMLLSKYSRYKEQNADNNVIQQEQILKAGVDLMKKFNEIEEHERNIVNKMTNSLKDGYSKKLAQMYCHYLVSETFSTHPKAQQRLDQLEKRIAHVDNNSK